MFRYIDFFLGFFSKIKLFTNIQVIFKNLYCKVSWLWIIGSSKAAQLKNNPNYNLLTYKFETRKAHWQPLFKRNSYVAIWTSIKSKWLK